MLQCLSFLHDNDDDNNFLFTLLQTHIFNAPQKPLTVRYVIKSPCLTAIFPFFFPFTFTSISLILRSPQLTYEAS